MLENDRVPEVGVLGPIVLVILLAAFARLQYDPRVRLCGNDRLEADISTPLLGGAFVGVNSDFAGQLSVLLTFLLL